MTAPDDASMKVIDEAKRTVETYRRAILTASGILITVPFLAESILVAFGHFTHLEIELVTISMLGSAASFAFTILSIINSYQKLAQASGYQLFVQLITSYPKEVRDLIPEKERATLVELAPKLVKAPFDLRVHSSRFFGVSEQLFELGVILLVVSLLILGLSLVS